LHQFGDPIFIKRNISMAGIKTINNKLSSFVRNLNCQLKLINIVITIISMNYSFEYIDIILLAMIAGFIFLRLRGILGKELALKEKPLLNLIKF
jgi:hypothetical protein